ncbi:excisionase [Nocardia nova]|nr:excisionase [Nocardia nova]
MRAARVFAVLVIVGVGAAAFRLSFATLRDLAKLAHIPASDAWLFPLIIDGTIVQATAGALVLAKSAERKFFTWVLVVGALVSVAGNSIHAVAAGKELPAWLCAIVAAIAPISLLVDTHGLAVLFRAAQSNPDPVLALVVAETEEDAPPAVEEFEEPAAPEQPAPVVPAAPVIPVAQPIPVSRPVQPPLLPVSVPIGG